MDPRWLVVVNPASGGGRAARRWSRHAPAFAQALPAHEVHFTCGPGDAGSAAASAAERGVRRFLAVGGDGTVNEVLNGLAPWLQPAPAERPVLAVLPAGTGNDWARSLALPTAPGAFAAALAAGALREQDVGELTFGDGRQHLFANVAGAGFDAHVLQHLPAAGPRALTYLRGVLRGVRGYAPPRLRQRLQDGTTLELARAFLAMAAINAYAGGGMHVAPGADAADGKLDFVAVEALSLTAVLGRLPKLYNGKLLGDRAVRWCRSPAAHWDVTPAAAVQADGQLCGHTPVTLAVRPRCLLVPSVAARQPVA